jgi:hypothetical protein
MELSSRRKIHTFNDSIPQLYYHLISLLRKKDKYVGTIQFIVHHIVFSSLSRANAAKQSRPDENVRINKIGSVVIRRVQESMLFRLTVGNPYFCLKPMVFDNFFDIDLSFWAYPRYLLRDRASGPLAGNTQRYICGRRHVDSQIGLQRKAPKLGRGAGLP